LGLSKLIELKNKLTKKDQLLELHRGQGMEIWFRDNFVCPTEEEYRSLVNKSKNFINKLILVIPNSRVISIFRGVSLSLVLLDV
jgi:hypothetical protein